MCDRKRRYMHRRSYFVDFSLDVETNDIPEFSKRGKDLCYSILCQQIKLLGVLKKLGVQRLVLLII